MNYMTANILLIEAINELNNLEEGESLLLKIYSKAICGIEFLGVKGYY